MSTFDLAVVILLSLLMYGMLGTCVTLLLVQRRGLGLLALTPDARFVIDVLATVGWPIVIVVMISRAICRGSRRFYRGIGDLARLYDARCGSVSRSPSDSRPGSPPAGPPI